MADYMVHNVFKEWIDDWKSGKTIKCSLHDATCDADDEDDNMGDITTLGELSGTGYVAGHGNAGRKTITLTAAVDDPNDQVEVDSTDPVWTAIDAGTAVTAQLHVEGSASDADAVRIGSYDVNKVTNGGDLTLQVDAEGWFKLTRV
jgi:hypothetical protein